MIGYETPLWAALNDILDKGRAPFHMPGHKGRLDFPMDTIAPYDMTEIDGADSLFEASGPLLELEQRIAAAYNAGASLISTGGSTLCIQTMLFLVRRHGRKILAARNIHRSAISAMGLLGIEPLWIPCDYSYNDSSGIDGLAVPPTPEVIEEMLYQNPDTIAVYLTSPDYFGQMADIPTISEICHSYNALLVVDNAHGAHLNRFRAAMHPMQLGADMCCDSFHKTLPVLTGGAGLHLADAALYEDAKYAMSLFGSTSPNYLIMLSIDRALYEMENGGQELLQLAGYIGALKDRLEEYGYQTIRRFVSDPIKLTVGFKSLGYNGDQFGQYIRSCGIEPEYIADSVVVFMPSCFNSQQELALLENALLTLPRRDAIPFDDAYLSIPLQPLSISEAMARPHIVIPVEKAMGRISARLVSKCPPGVPLVVPGEEITAETIYQLKISGITNIYVVK